MIFVSYSWTNEQPDEKVLRFVDFLRKNGFEATCDIIYKQQETAINFTEMMAKCLRESSKVIIILSEEYKNKADSFIGGVGEEYRYIITDINSNKNKYILVSFQSLTNDIKNKITPDFLNNREIIDLIKDEKEEYRELFSKLNSQDSFIFSDINPTKTTPTPKRIGDFNLNSKINNDIFAELGISKIQEVNNPSEFEKDNFLKDSFKKIIDLLSKLLNQLREENPSIQVVIEEIDKKTITYEIYKNGEKRKDLKISCNNMLFSNTSIFISDTKHQNSWNAIISCVVDNGILKLSPTFGFTRFTYDTTYETEKDIVKGIWETFIEPYIKDRY